MENQFVLPTSVVCARNTAQQLIVHLNLPVRIISADQVIDVLPLKDDPDYVPKRVRKNAGEGSYNYPTLNELLLFFKACLENDLLSPREVARIYQVNIRTVSSWSQSGLLKRYRIAPGLTVYKRSELPALDVLYGPYEL